MFHIVRFWSVGGSCRIRGELISASGWEEEEEEDEDDKETNSAELLSPADYLTCHEQETVGG